MQALGVLGYKGTPEYTEYFYIKYFIHANDPGIHVILSCGYFWEFVSLSEGSFSLGFKLTVFANSLRVNFSGDKRVDCMAPRGPCMPFNDGIITTRDLNVFYQMFSGENNNSRYLAHDDI